MENQDNIQVINAKDTSINLGMTSHHVASDFRGISGIMNLGNTCYMNSTIQVISHTYYLRKYLLENEELVVETLFKNVKKIFPDMINCNLINCNVLEKKINSDTYKITDLTDTEKTIILNSTMTYQMIKLLRELWSGRVTVVPTSFRTVFMGFREKFFFGTAQHDSIEAYTCIIQKIDEELGIKSNIVFRSHNKSMEVLLKFKTEIQNKMDATTSQELKVHYAEEYKRKKDSMPIESLLLDSYKEMKKVYAPSFSKIKEIFSGFEHTEIKCPACSHLNHKFELYYQINLTLGEDARTVTNTDIIDYLDKHFSTEILDEKNALKCSKCEKYTEAELRKSLWTTPVILVINFVRFVKEMALNRIILRKDNTFITYPLTKLNISSIISPLNKDTTKCYEYDLYAVINHTGDMNAGHYYTYCLDEQTNKWYVYNDAHVQEISVNSVVNQSAYMLFYIRRDMIQTD